MASKKIKLLRGQFVTSLRQIYESLKIERNKTSRILKHFKSEQLIEQQTNNRQTLITLPLWDFYQSLKEEPFEQQLSNQRATEQETEREKEKRSKREKEKEKETNKNIRSVCIDGDTHADLLSLGRYKNVFVDKAWLDEFKRKYWYWDNIIEKLSVYKQAKNIKNADDTPYLEQFAIEDKDKYVRRDSSFDTFDADEFFAAALARSYADDD